MSAEAAELFDRMYSSLTASWCEIQDKPVKEPVA